MKPRALYALGCAFALSHCYWLTSYQDLTSDTPPNGPWQLVFSDEFDGAALDTNKWATHYDRSGDRARSDVGNDESEWYLDENVVVADGVLSLTAKRQPYTSPSNASFDYTSGMITSKPSFHFEYGYVEARMRLPKGSGFHPSFWMWPYSEASLPELDVVAAYGNDPTRLYCAYHPEGSGDPSGYTPLADDWTAGWHVFALDREPQGTTWYIDGKQVFPPTPPANADLYLIFTLAISSQPKNSGNPPGPDASTVFPSSLQIDWVRAFRHP